MSRGRATLAAAGALTGIIVLYYWKILLTHQFSMLTGYEGANQAYAWMNYWVRSIKQGAFPLWDPYSLCGHLFSGEMQTGAFYPLYLPLALFKFNRYGLLSPSLYQIWFVLSHLLAAWFMFLLIRELKLGDFPAILSGLVFSLGGALGHMPDWPHLLNSGIWLPLIFLFLLRATRASNRSRTIRNALFCGLCLGLSILAGGLHMAVMQTIVVVTAAIYEAFGSREWRRNAWIIGMAGVVAFTIGAVQLLPSAEYSRLAVRFITGGPVPASQRMPYRSLVNRLYANAILNLVFGLPRTEAGFGETLIPYLGVFPFLLAVTGIWKAWAHRWVRYLTGLAVAAFAYSLGPASLLHGVLYAITPYLWLAHEADRFTYLVDFALAVLAAYGAQALFLTKGSNWEPLVKILRWTAIGALVALIIPAIYSAPALTPWIALSLVFIAATWLLFQYSASGHTGTAMRVAAVSFILFDIATFDFTGLDYDEMTAKGANEFDRLLSCRGAVRFVQAQSGLFRVQMVARPTPNIGDAFEVQAADGSGVTQPITFTRANGHPDLLNVRYFVKPASAPDSGAVYQDKAWKVYDNPHAFPRAWLVHDTAIEPVPLDLQRRLDNPNTDLHRVALLPAPLDAALDGAADESGEQVHIDGYAANAMDLTVHANGRALLMLSEIYYPGWVATVNGRAARIWEADGALRAIVVPQGDSRVSLRFRPLPIYIGAALTLFGFAAVLVAGITLRAAR